MSDIADMVERAQQSLARDGNIRTAALLADVLVELRETAATIRRLESEVERLGREVQGERAGRARLDAALRGKDEAMSKLFAHCESKGVDLSEFIS